VFGALGAIPALPGALCRGQSELWDEPPQHDRDPVGTTERLSYALRCCQRCPALNPCRTWYATLPARRRPPGVVAGIAPQGVGA
jgi:hypothetical protein